MERDIWSLRIAEAKTPEELRTLEDSLLALDAPWARPLRLLIRARLLAIGRAAASVPVAPAEAFASAYGVAAPDGRWLHRYRLSAEAFARLQNDLAGLSPLALQRGYTPGLFVLWASEWFRRCYRGGGHRWIDLARALRIAEDQTLFRALSGKGLAQWRRDVLATGNGSEYLGSLAREGGFPTAAVEDGGSGWAHGVLAAIVGPLLAEPAAGEERALELAALQRGRLPQLFRDDEFIALCADMALAVVRLRRDADGPAAAADLPVVAWLELNRPGWQAELPLSTSDAAASALVERLMKVVAASGGAVTVERYLLHAQDNGGGGWVEAAQVSLDGALDPAAMRNLDPSLGRLRVFAAGEMARSLPGELALLDAPADGQTAWTARSTRRARGVQRLPFAAAIELDFRSGEQRVARIALAGGKPRRGALIVTEIVTGEPDAPTLLRVVGSGSGKYRAQTVVVQVPADWRVDATAGESVVPLGRGAGQGRLWQVTAGAFVTDERGDRYRIQCGQPRDEASRLELVGNRVGWAEVSGAVDLFAGPPLVRIGEGALHVRAMGERSWQPAPKTLPVGHYELGWLRDRIVQDRRRIAVLPAGAQVTRHGGHGTPEYRIAGFGACGIDPAEDAPVRVAADGTWRPRAGAQPVHWFTAIIDWPDGPDLPVRINHPVAAAIARWDGQVLPDGARVTLADLPDLVAINAGRVQMFGELRLRGLKLAEMSWEVVDELPMASVAADIASMALPASIDAEVRLGMHDGIETWWRVRQFGHELTLKEGQAFVAEGIVAEGAELVGRCLARPAEERSFGAYSLLTNANHRPAVLPPLAGDWLVYLRAGDTVLTRPRFHRGTGAAEPAGRLGQAMALPPGRVLDGALADLLVLADSDDGGPVIAELLALIASLDGLLPATFRMLELTAERPGVLVRLAMTAAPDQREAVMALSDALPFAWATIGRECWQRAQGAAFGALLTQLAALGGDAPRFAKDSVEQVVARLCELEPLLAPVLQPATAPTINDAAQAFVQRARDRIPGASRSRYRARLPGRMPAYFDRFDDAILDTLDAPCAAAAAVVGLWLPAAEDIHHIKTVARTFPTYFAEAFAASLNEYR